jgi:hypothetical protein
LITTFYIDGVLIPSYHMDIRIIEWIIGIIYYVVLIGELLHCMNCSSITGFVQFLSVLSLVNLAVVLSTLVHLLL